MSRPSASTVRVVLALVIQKVWVRATLFTAIAIGFALAAGFIGSLLPFSLSIELGQNAVDSVLQIIATAMLTATTFSVTAMVTAYSSATTIATPRSTKLLIADPTSQNALSTFIGAFVFALVGIIALSTGYYTEQGRTILFIGTLVVVGIIVVTLLRWIAHLADFGRMSDVIDRVEEAATASLATYIESPTRGARRGRRFDMTVPVLAERIGYVQHIDVAALDRVAHEHDLEICVEAIPGTVADAAHPLVTLDRNPDDAVAHGIRRAFRLASHRDFEQDPRLGVIALSEIGSRALSPGTNDPGTAIEVIAALQRVFGIIPDRSSGARGDVEFTRVWMTAPSIDDLVTDAFRPLARDGARMVEVQIRLQKCLAALAAQIPSQHAVFARAAADGLRRSRRAMDPTDFRRLRAAARASWRPARSAPGPS